jgi:hypothetical protein
MVRSFKLSRDPQFAAKVRDVVGLYVDPPAHAVVLSVDERSQIQALDRTQPGLPMKPGCAGTMTHDYVRNSLPRAKAGGTTTLFAALNVLDGRVGGPHFTPTSASWLNAVEGSFAKLTRRRPQRACSIPSSTSTPRSTAISPITIEAHARSPGPPTPTPSSPPPAAGIKCWIQSNRAW